MAKKSIADDESDFEYPILVVGLESYRLSGAARAIERKEKFKCILAAKIRDLVGSSTEMRSIASDLGFEAGSLSDEDEATYIQTRLQKKGNADKIDFAQIRSGCRATPTGWIREWRRRVVCV